MIDNLQQQLNLYQPQSLQKLKEYAVLLPLIKHHDAWHILFQVRSALIKQPGDVSFPGGAVEENEPFAKAAIRETIEELRVKENEIRLLGEIDYLINANNKIHCFVGELLIDDWTKISPNEEVQELFIVPLATLKQNPPTYHDLLLDVNPDSKFPFELIQKGIHYPFSQVHRQIPFYNVSEHTIWGLTALFTHQFIKKFGNILKN